MELNDLLRKQRWQQSTYSYSTQELEEVTHSNVRDQIKKLYRHYYRSLALNGLFLLLTVIAYWLNPIPAMLLPVALIASCFLFLLVNCSSLS